MKSVAWPTKISRKVKKIKSAVKLIAILIIGFYVVSYAMGDDVNLKDKIDDLKPDKDGFKDVESSEFDVSFDTDEAGDIKEIKIKI